jgi:hypothetical protein
MFRQKYPWNIAGQRKKQGSLSSFRPLTGKFENFSVNSHLFSPLKRNILQLYISTSISVFADLTNVPFRKSKFQDGEGGKDIVLSVISV